MKLWFQQMRISHINHQLPSVNLSYLVPCEQCLNELWICYLTTVNSYHSKLSEKLGIKLLAQGGCLLARL